MDPVAMWPTIPDVSGGAPIDPAIEGQGQGQNLNGIAAAAQGLAQGQKDGRVNGGSMPFTGPPLSGVLWAEKNGKGK
ncbi:Hypothetical protein D9617_10g073280 [Elsinoe fawcettii]|nr:Hypothetical protein D9617_10g073280 [Elsinoe fawcettii]